MEERSQHLHNPLESGLEFCLPSTKEEFSVSWGCFSLRYKEHMTESGELNVVCACLTALCILREDFLRNSINTTTMSCTEAMFFYCYNNELKSPNSKHHNHHSAFDIQSPLTGYVYLKPTSNCSFTMPQWQTFITCPQTQTHMWQHLARREESLLY